MASTPPLVRDARHHADDEVVQGGPPAGDARQRLGLFGDADLGIGGEVSEVSRGPRVSPPRHRRRRHGVTGENVAATHVPVYDLTAAAGFWGPESVPEEIGWTEVAGVAVKPGMFVARVTGTSMEPLIPDGS